LLCVPIGVSTLQLISQLPNSTDVPGTLTDAGDDDRGITDLPAEFRLLQNYPNPFNPATTIAFDLAAASHVTLRVYDVLGRLVASPADEVRPAGRNTVSWNASGHSSGVYFYRMTASDRAGKTIHSDVMKMVLLR